jgi:O-antigen/teichoic acid export membrane protein
MAFSSQNVRNSGWSIVNILLYPIAFMGLTPVFISRMGEMQFGVWMLVNSYVYIAVNIISFGFSNSITAHVAEALGKNDRGKLFGYLNASTRILGLITVSTALPALFFLIAYLLFPGFKFYDRALDLVLLVATLLISVKFYELLYQSIFKGFERFDLSGRYNILNKFLVLGLQLFLVIRGSGLLSMFVGSLIINLVVITVQGFVVHRLVPDFRFRWRRYPVESKELFAFGFWTWIQTIISVAAYQVDRFVVAFALGPVVAGYYILASTIANHMHMAFGAIGSWLFPKVARQKEVAQDTRIYFHSLRGVITGVSLLMILALSLLYKPFFTLWLGPEKFAKIDSFFALFLMYESFLILSIVPLFYLNGIKMLRLITFLELMYKSGILIGMFVAFAMVPTGESLLLGQVIALVVLMPVEYFVVNKRILHDTAWGETVIAIIPSLCIVCTIYFNQLPLTIGLSMIAIVTFISYYLKPSRFNLKLLLA